MKVKQKCVSRRRSLPDLDETSWTGNWICGKGVGEVTARNASKYSHRSFFSQVVVTVANWREWRRMHRTCCNSVSSRPFSMKIDTEARRHVVCTSSKLERDRTVRSAATSDSVVLDVELYMLCGV